MNEVRARQDESAKSLATYTDKQSEFNSYINDFRIEKDIPLRYGGCSRYGSSRRSQGPC